MSLNDLIYKLDDKWPEGDWRLRRWGRKKIKEEMEYLITSDLRSWSVESKNGDVHWGKTPTEAIEKALNEDGK